MCFFEGTASSRGNFDNYLPYISQIEITVNDLANKILRVAISEVDACMPLVIIPRARPTDIVKNIVLKKCSWKSAFAMRLSEQSGVQHAYVKAPISGFMVLAEDEETVSNVLQTLKDILYEAYQLFKIKIVSGRQAQLGYQDYGSSSSESQDHGYASENDL